MTRLPHDLMMSIFEYVPYATLHQLLTQTDVDWNIPSKMKQDIDHKKKYILDHIPSVLINIFSLNELLDATILEWNDAFIGCTDYIDRIQTSDVDNAICIGVDRFHRAFVCIRIMDIEREKTFVYTLFQRYTDNITSWTYGCHYPSFLNTSGYIMVGNTIEHKEFKDKSVA